MSPSERIDPTPHVIELVGVSKMYRTGDIEVAALRDVSLTIDDNEFVAIIGPSGSGKSTLMHILGCLDVPTSGRFRLAGHDVASRSTRTSWPTSATSSSGSCSSSSTCSPTCRPGATSSCRSSTPASARPSAGSGRWPRSPRSASPTGRTTGRASSPAASSSASPSPGRSSPSRR